MKILVCCKFLMFMLIAFCILGCNQPYDLGVNMQDPFQETQPGNGDAGTTDTTTPDLPELVEVGDRDVETTVISDVEEPEPETGEHELKPEDLAALLPDIEGPVPPDNGDNGTGPYPVRNPPEPRDNDPPEIIDSNIKDGAEGVGRSNLIWIRFNEPVVDGDLRLRIKGGGTVETRVNYGNERVDVERLGKDIVMRPLTTYVIEGAVSDDAGNETDVEITFTTGEENF